MAIYADITGWGMCMPPAVMTNDDLATVLDTSDEWIKSRSGISERRVSHVPGSDLAAVAGHRALAAAGLAAEELDLLIIATCTPDTVIPSRSPLLRNPEIQSDLLASQTIGNSVQRISPAGDDHLWFTFSDECWVEVLSTTGENLYSDLSRSGQTLDRCGEAHGGNVSCGHQRKQYPPQR